MLERLNLDGKVVLVTGGGTGLGFAMVTALAEAGANLAIAGRRQQPIDVITPELRRAQATSQSGRLQIQSGRGQWT